MKYKYLLMILLISAFIISCNDFVTDIDPTIDVVQEDQLNTEAAVDFLIKGVQTKFAEVTSYIALTSDALSDQFVFDRDVPDATFMTFEQIETGQILLDNNQNDFLFEILGELRFVSDNLVERTGNISFSSEEHKNEALFTGYFYGGIARMYYATYFGLNRNEGGGVIDDGPFIPSNDMFALAIQKYNEALSVAANDYERRLVNSFIAKSHLFNENYTAAASFATNGLVENDEALLAKFSLIWTNYFYEEAGNSRTQWIVNSRFQDYIAADPTEANRLPLQPILGKSGTTHYYQDKYPSQESSMDVMTWQEIFLMQAELALRGNGSANPVEKVNKVRTSHTLSDLTIVDLDVIYIERDKELLGRGARLPDQRRFGRWHLDSTAWHFLPISKSERNNNPNLIIN